MKYIGNYAFNNCNKLNQLSIDLYQTKYSENSFNECSSLHHLILLTPTNTINKNSFENHFINIGHITKITIPNMITEIKENSFKNCSTLKEIILPPTLNRIESNSFSKCSSLTQIKIPSSVTEIGSNSFSECSSLEQIEIPSSITKLKESLFQQCSSLTQIEIPNSVTEIESYSFSECSSLEQIKIPSSVIKIGDKSFKECKSLKQIIIPENVEYIGSYSFYECKSLEQVIIQTQIIKQISTSLFEKCSSLEHIKIPISVNEIEDNAFSECSSLKQIEIPSYVFKIGSNIFYKCTSLEQVTIPRSLNQIGWNIIDSNINNNDLMELFKENVFLECPSLKKLKFFEVNICCDSSVKIDDYDIGKTILKTKYASITLATKKSTGKIYAFKVISSDFIKNMVEFLLILSSIPKIKGMLQIQGYHLPASAKDNPLIYKNTIDYSYDKNDYILITDYMKNGSISKIMEDYLLSHGQKNSKMNPTIRSKIIFGVAAIMKKLHKKYINDIDLTNGNIYLDDNLEPLISMFSISKYISKRLEGIIMTSNFEYTAPELLMNDEKDFKCNYQKSDVYSFAIFLYKMFSTKVLLPGGTKPGIYIQRIINNERPNRPENIPDCYWDLIQECWSSNPDERPSFDEIVDILKNDEYSIEEFGMKTNMEELHEYQKRIKHET